MIHENQVRRADLAEVHPEWVYPEVVEAFRITRRNVPSHTFIETETRKEPEGRRQHALAVRAFLGRCRKLRRPRDI
jgi:hypothetical protein